MVLTILIQEKSKCQISEMILKIHTENQSMNRLAAVAALLLICACSASAGEEALHYNIVNLDASSSAQVANDVMVVVMQAAAEKNSAVDAGHAVNDMMKWADSVIAGNAAVQHRTMNYQTLPVYQNQTIAGWSVVQQLRLQSGDFEVLSTMVGTLQQQLQVSSMHFEISPERRKQEVDKLIVAALGAFRDKADLIAATLKAQDHRIVALSVADNPVRIPYNGGIQMEAMSAARAPAPVVEAGDSTVQVSVSGSIQLIF